MRSQTPAVIRTQLDKTLSEFNHLRPIPMPRKGWVRAVRSALNMSGRQLAARMNKDRRLIAALERREVEGVVSIESLRRAAEAMDCMLVYAIVPRTSLQDMVERQARQLVKQRQASVSHSMSLEDQGLSQQERKEIINSRVEELMRTMPRTLWDTIN